MRNLRIAVTAVSAFLCAAMLRAEAVLPLIVETGKPVPTVVRTAEFVTITYTVKRIDMSTRGHDMEVMILEKESFGFQGLGDFDVAKMEVSKEIHRDGPPAMFYKTYTFTLRIIDPKKGEYKIPPIKVLWIYKQTGISEEDGEYKETKPFVTKERTVRYDSSIVKEGDFNIRDELIFPDINRNYIYFWIMSLVTAFIGLGGLIYVLSEAQPRREKKEGSGKRERFGRIKRYLRWRKAVKELVVMASQFNRNDEYQLEIFIHKLIFIVKTKLFANVPDISKQTPDDMLRSITGNFRPSERKRILTDLAIRLRLYVMSLESTHYDLFTHEHGLKDELKLLKKDFRDLRRHRRLLKWLRHPRIRLPWKR